MNIKSGIIFFMLINLSILSQDKSIDKENENAANQKSISDIEASLKKNQEDLAELKKRLGVKENPILEKEKFISPSKVNGLNPEYNRSMFLDPEHAKKFNQNEKAWLNDWVRVGALIRPRFEDRYNLAFDKQNKGNISRIMQTTQFFLLIDPSPNFTMKITFQDARVLGGSAPAPVGDIRAFAFDGVGNTTNAGQANSIPSATTLREGWFMIKKLPLDAKLQIGRQIISYGDQRMIGGANWTIGGLSYDGARLMFDQKNFNIHLLGYKITENQSGPNGVLSSSAPIGKVDPATGRTVLVNPGLPKQYLVGTYNSFKKSNWFLIDLYSLGFLSSKTQNFSGANIPSQGVNIAATPDSDLTTNSWSKQKNDLWTTGFRLTNRTEGNNLGKDSPYKSWDWTFEAAWQTGITGTKVIKDPIQNAGLNAIYSESQGLRNRSDYNLLTENQKYTGHMYVFQTGYTFFEKFRVGIQYLLSSGDSRLNDGSKSTFQTLTNPRLGVFPNWNNIAGFSENIDTKNLTSKTINLSYKTESFGSFYASYFWNDKTKTQDSWYAVNGIANTGATVEQASTTQSTQNLAKSNRGIYTELDLTWIYGINDNVSLWIGGGYLVAGGSVRNQKDAVLNVDTRTGGIGFNQNVLLGQSGVAPKAYMFFMQMNATF